METNPRRNCCFIFIADHQGVMNNGGRIGTAEGPKAFLEQFERLRGRYPISDAILEQAFVKPISSSVKENHAKAIELIKTSHLKHGLSVIVGGGHDHGYSHLAGVRQALDAQAGKKVRLGCINLDAHFDLRKPNSKITSGAPFYLAIEEKVIRGQDLVELGIQSHCNGPDLWKYAEQNKVNTVSFDTIRNGGAAEVFQSELTKLEKNCDAVVLSLDLDCMSQAFAPGVSAPQAEGMSSSDVISNLEIAAKSTSVVSLGVFELNPLHDRDGATARVAATGVYHFIQNACF